MFNCTLEQREDYSKCSRRSVIWHEEDVPKGKKEEEKKNMVSVNISSYHVTFITFISLFIDYIAFSFLDDIVLGKDENWVYV